LLKGAFQGKESIVVRVEDKDGEKKLVFDTHSGASSPELAAAGTENKG
jgi:hypothetical protein